MEIQITAPRAMQGVQARAYIDCLRRDLPFHGFVGAYAAAVPLIGAAFGAQQRVMSLSFFTGALQSLGLVLLMVLAGTGLWSLPSPSPVKAWRSSFLRACGPGTLASALLCVSLLTTIAVFSSMKQMLPDIVPFFADPYLADLDRLVHGQDPWRLATAAMPLRLMPALEGLYLGPWGFIMMGATLAALFAPALRNVRAQYVWTFLIIWPVLGNVLAGALLSAGPVFYEQVTGGDARFSGLISYLTSHSHQAWVQNFLWSAYSSASPGVAGAGISAFPSMHVASATLFALLAARSGRRWVRWTGAGYCAVILFGSVLLGWHYAVDGYFSIAATVLIWKAVGWALKR